MPDYRLNSRSPYYIDGEVEITEVTPPPPVEENTPPTVTITASNDTPYVGETITLTAVATDSDGTVVSYSWNTSETTTSIDVVRNKELCHDFYVVVTDDDGDTATATKRICWQEVPDIITNPETTDVSCGETFGEGSFTGEIVYRITDVGDKIGDIELFVIAPQGGSFDVPVNFTLEWNGLTASTGYVGSSTFDDELLGSGVELGDIFTLSETTKSSPTSVSLTKSAATPTEVLIRATTPLINDQFQLITSCPDVIPAVTTKYYTLEGTDVGGDTTFTYTDNNGDSQNVILSDGETELISAREDSVSVVSGTGNITEGGLSFDNGTPDLIVDTSTEFWFILDSTGSMGATAQYIEGAINNNLKSDLLSYYENDPSLYDRRTNFFNVSQERIFAYPESYESANISQYPRIGKRVYFLFQDESHARYHNIPYDGALKSSFSTDIANLRSFLDGKNETDFGNTMVVLFSVTQGKIEEINASDAYASFISDVVTGAGNFSGANGFSDRSDVKVIQNVQYLGDSELSVANIQQYYYNIIKSAIQGLGYNI